MKKIDTIKLYYHTIKYLKFKQIFYRLWYKFYHPHINRDIIFKLRQKKNNWHTSIAKRNDYFHDNNVIFLNHAADISSSQCWNDNHQAKLWLYNLHYFDGLLSKSKNQTELAYQLLQRWVKENPPFYGNGWEPYPVSLRIVNIVKYALNGNILSEAIERNLYLQARYLNKHYEYHILGNHLFENIKALCFAGLFFDTDESKRWFEKARKELKKQIDEQILSDGGHFELSPMYHCIILEGMLDLYNVFNVYGLSFSWEEKIRSMINWLSAMQRPNNEISYFNDAANDIAASPDTLREYAKELSLNDVEVSNKIRVLKDSEYIVCGLEREKLIIDVAKVGPDYLPGHAHADTLSFEFYLDNYPVFVNLGTSCYGLSDRRLFERGTTAHNTIAINNLNSTEVWSSFRVARRAYVDQRHIDHDNHHIDVSATHNGYQRLSTKLRHNRRWLLKKNSLTIADQIKGTFNQAQGFLHLHPCCTITSQDHETITITLPNKENVIISHFNNYVIIDNNYVQSFGKLLTTKTIVINYNQNSCQSEIVMRW